MSKLEISHVERPELPWRKPEQTLTECGLVAASFPTISRAELIQRHKEWGQQRTAMGICMTCLNTAQSWGPWEIDPLDGIQRAIKFEPSYWGFVRHGQFREINKAPAPNSPLRVELRAMAILVERHREEFDGIITGLGAVVNLDQKRLEAKERRKRPTTIIR